MGTSRTLLWIAACWLALAPAAGRAEDTTTPKQKALGAGWVHFQKGSYAEAYQALKPQAEKGNDEAQYLLGWMHQTGQGAERDLAQAGQWYEKSAVQGHTSARNNLCTVHLETRDFKRAVPWCEKSAKAGHMKSQFLFAMMHFNGEGVEKSAEGAVAWLKKSAEQGYAAAEYKLGMAYESGIGVPKDLKSAAQYYERAAKQRYKDAAVRLLAVQGRQ
jgi:uncharacterized protein